MTIPYQPRSKKKRRQIRTDDVCDAIARKAGNGNISLGVAVALREWKNHHLPNMPDDPWYEPIDSSVPIWRNAPESEKE